MSIYIMNKEMQSFNISRSGFHHHFALKSSIFSFFCYIFYTFLATKYQQLFRRFCVIFAQSLCWLIVLWLSGSQRLSKPFSYCLAPFTVSALKPFTGSQTATETIITAGLDNYPMVGGTQNINLHTLNNQRSWINCAGAII